MIMVSFWEVPLATIRMTWRDAVRGWKQTDQGHSKAGLGLRQRRMYDRSKSRCNPSIGAIIRWHE